MTKTLVPFEIGCEQLAFHPNHVRRLIRAGKIKPPVPLYEGGHRKFYTQEYLDELLAKATAPLHECEGDGGCEDEPR